MIIVVALLLSMGGVLRHTLHCSWLLFFVILCVSTGIFLYYFQTKRAVAYACIGCCVLVLGFFLVYRAEQQHSRVLPQGKQTMSGTVVSVNERLQDSVIDIDSAECECTVRSTIAIVPTTMSTHILPGDSITLSGVAALPEDFITPTGRIFPYQQFLQGKGISLLLQKSHIVSLRQGSFFSMYGVTRLATIARNAIASLFATYIRFPIDGIVAGMVVGYQGGLSESVQELFRNTGVLHVLVLSGYNITLLAGALHALLHFMPVRIRAIIVMVATLLIVLISGSGIAAVRAGIMAMVALLATLQLRSYQPLPALAVAYCICFCLSPEQVFSDPGFHLSFLATVFMVVFLPTVQKWCSFIPKTKGVDLQELLVLSLSSPLFMLPYTMYFSGLMPIASPIANALFAIITPPLMLSGVLIMCCAIAPPVASLVGVIVSIVGEKVLLFLQWCGSIPQMPTPQLEWWGVVLWYCCVAFIVHRSTIMQFVLQYRNVLLQPSN